MMARFEVRDNKDHCRAKYHSMEAAVKEAERLAPRFGTMRIIECTEVAVLETT